MTGRKARLYASALLRGYHPASDRLKYYADGLISYSEFREPCGPICQHNLLHRESRLAVNSAVWHLYYCTEDVRIVPWCTERVYFAGLCVLQEVKPCKVPDRVRDIARVIYQDEDWDAMPIFADMLDELELTEFAAHCRTSFHARGCHVLESILCG